MGLEQGQGLGGWEIATAKKVVAECRRRYRILEREEFEDLMQECLTHWVVVRRRIPPEPDAPPPVAYMAQVVRNKLTDLVREMTADKRAGDPGAFSLEEPVDGSEDGLTLGEVLADERVDPASSGGMDTRHARIDLDRVMALLTPAQQRLCRMLGEPVDQGGLRKAPNPARHGLRGDQAHPPDLRSPGAGGLSEGLTRHFPARFRTPDHRPDSARNR